MPDRSLENNSLGSNIKLPAKFPTYEYILDLDVSPGNPGKIIFQYSRSASQNVEDPMEPKTQLLDIKIDQHCIVDVRLADRWDWHWAAANAVTTARDLRTVYGDLQYFDEKENDWVDSSENPCRRIRFSANYVEGLPGAKEPFNFNVDLGVNGGKYLPIVIDPDLRNPGSIPITLT
jgi:hypothetical protein